MLRDLLQLEKSVYILLTWIPGLEPGMGMGQEGEASKGKEDVLNNVDSGEESRSGKSGLYDSGMETLESDYNQQHRDLAQTCSSTADCNSPSDSP